MKIDEIKYPLKNIWKRKLRSSLTVLSILIGIASIFALVSFGLGIKDYVNTVADQAGRDKLFIQAKGIGAPGTDENFFISDKDIDFVKKIKGVKEAVGLYMGAGEVNFDRQIKYNFIIGFDPDKREFIESGMNLDVIKGRALKKGDASKVFLGYNYQLDDKIFKKGLKAGDKIELNKNLFEIVGFYSEVGNPQDDAQIYITDKEFEALFPSKKNKFGFVLAQSEKGILTKGLAEKIQEKLRKFKGQEEGKEDFFVQTFEDALATFGVVINVINGVLFLIALISLIVASVNIMNTMYTAVLERTKEIGVMKAIGATNEEILLIFVFESGFLGFLGGLIGVIIGYAISVTGGDIAAASGYALLKPIFPWYLIMGCLLFATLVGTGAGLLPARQASRQMPVDALRYE